MITFSKRASQVWQWRVRFLSDLIFDFARHKMFLQNGKQEIESEHETEFNRKSAVEYIVRQQDWFELELVGWSGEDLSSSVLDEQVIGS